MSRESKERRGGKCIGLYRDVWITAIASSRTSLATLTGVMCNTSQCELRSLRVHSGMLNVIRIVTYYTLPPLESPDSFWDCNGVFAIKAYGQRYYLLLSRLLINCNMAPECMQLATKQNYWSQPSRKNMAFRNARCQTLDAGAYLCSPVAKFFFPKSSDRVII